MFSTNSFATKHADAIARFFEMTRKAGELIASSDKAWAAAQTRIATKNPALIDLYRKRYVAGVPKRSFADEEADAATLYKVLAVTGGEKLVGPGKSFDPQTFYRSGIKDKAR